MIREKFDLTGRTALVTGSTRGIGQAIGAGLAEFGARVLTHGISSGDVCFDLSDPAAIEAAFKTLPPIDILVANASVQQRMKWHEFDLEEARREAQVNYIATLQMFQLVYPHMKAQRWGRMIVVGSVQEQRPHPDMIGYSTTKSAQENLVRSVARQVAAEGITVNNLCPGVFATDRNRDVLADPVYREKVLNAIPMHQAAQPEDAVGTALLLASDAGRYITGATIRVDGGLSLPG